MNIKSMKDMLIINMRQNKLAWFSSIGLIAITTCLLLIQFYYSSPATIPGYIEGRLTYITAERNGILKKLFVQKGQQLKTGQMLFALEDYPERLLLQQNITTVQDLQYQQKQHISHVQYLTKFLKRRELLYQQQHLDLETVETVRDQLLIATAALQDITDNLIIAKSKLTQSNWEYQKKFVRSTVSGQVFDSYYTPGELITNNKPILSILTDNNLYYIFYLPEAQLSQIQLQQKIQVNCDNQAKPTFAQINFISAAAEFTPPILYTESQRSSLMYRVEARPIIQSPVSCQHPGQPVSIRLINN